ncbi:hypothetical protein OUZ56_012335 [Daphnia magna]|uniref:Retrotransposon gag domain-containing protein n=1 Tax=Daphnia magna TaxID=35525 RepID=A0ABQ9Z2U9_9CRUS|nr:hypothetical protein OUZ56_012335 [Daphnia magna]
MNDDVATGGHKLVHSLVNKHSQPEIAVTPPDQETVFRSLDFDNLATETQFAPDTLQSGRTFETTAEAISRSTSSVLNPKVHSNNSQLRKLRSNAAYKAVAGLPEKLEQAIRPRLRQENDNPPFSLDSLNNAPNGKSLEPEPKQPIQQSQEQPRHDIPDQCEQASVPNTCDQEPEGERSGFPVERPEGSDTDNSADKGHPTDESISRRPEPIVGVEGTNDPSEVLDVNPRVKTQCTVEEDDSNGTTYVRADSDFHVVCETVLDPPTGTVSQHNRLAERQGYLGINTELWDYIQTQRGSILPSFARSGKPIHSLEDGIADLPTNISDGHSQPHLIPTGAATTDSTGTTEARDQLTAEEVGQLTRSQQTEQSTARRGDQTNAPPNQNPIETTAITGYHGPDITVTHVTTTKYRRCREPLYHRYQYDTPSTALFGNHTTSLQIDTTFPRNNGRGGQQTLLRTSIAYEQRFSTVSDLFKTTTWITVLPPPEQQPPEIWMIFKISSILSPGYNYFLLSLEALLLVLTLDRAFSVIQAILKEHPLDYETIKQALLDHFHGDENIDLCLQKFNKAKRKLGEKDVDYALRLQEIFIRAYPVSYSEKSFAVILMQKFIEGLDSKLHAKVKYKKFKDFNELVAATRVYALRLEALETDREKQEFIRSIDGSQDTSNAELKEIKQMIIDQKEVVNKAVANIRHGDKPVGKKNRKQRN